MQKNNSNSSIKHSIHTMSAVYDSLHPGNTTTKGSNTSVPYIPMPGSTTGKVNGGTDYESLHQRSRSKSMSQSQTRGGGATTRSMYVTSKGTKRTTGASRLKEKAKNRLKRAKRKARRRMPTTIRSTVRVNDTDSDSDQEQDDKLTFGQDIALIVTSEDNKPEICPRITAILIFTLIVTVSTYIVLSSSTEFIHPSAGIWKLPSHLEESMLKFIEIPIFQEKS